MRYEYLCIAVIAIMWGGYPLVARASGIGGAVGALTLTVMALIPVGAAVAWQALAQGITVKPDGAALIKLAIAGLMMGIGLVAFNVLANSRNLDASISIPIADTAMLITTVVGAILFFAEPITARKLIGIALMIAGIAVLKPA